ncbi:MAG: hypothetical protein HQK50_08025 [Oligoflexia bacterium]|nr:hypothetical protein [Oligoflexia bacterium]MBF0365504.1 hypothetical protein [Oligoflexia bacterium]
MNQRKKGSAHGSSGDSDGHENTGSGGIGMSSVFKKLVTTGLEAASKTEGVVKEVKDALSEMHLPKEVISLITQQLRGTKEELLQAITSGIEEHMKKANITQELQKEIQKVLENYDLEIEGKIRFKRKVEVQDKSHEKDDSDTRTHDHQQHFKNQE